jgi:hypothetical protein
MGGDKFMSKEPMTKEAASRIQSNSDKTGKNSDFKERAQSSAAKNSRK